MEQTEVAERLGVATSTISRWERGAQPVKDRDLLALAQLYKVSVDDLTGIANSQSETPRRGQRVRAWLSDFRATLEDEGLPDEVVDAAIAMLRAPLRTTFFAGGRTEMTDEQAIAAMESVAASVRTYLSEIGREA